jgi:hypothetical protein
MARRDYKQTEDGDLYFDPVTGDLEVVDSDEQHIQDIVMAAKGDYREFPLLGVDAIKFKNSSGRTAEFVRAIKEELAKDGYPGMKVILNGNNLEDFTISDNG